MFPPFVVGSSQDVLRLSGPDDHVLPGSMGRTTRGVTCPSDFGTLSFSVPQNNRFVSDLEFSPPTTTTSPIGKH